MAWVWSRIFGPCRLLLVRRALPAIDLVTVVVNIDGLDSIPFIRSLHMLRRRARVLWAGLLIARARWIRSTGRSTWWRVTIFGLKRDGLLSISWFLPGISHGISLAHKSTPQAVITYQILVNKRFLDVRLSRWLSLHSGCCSSHFFFLLLHVMHPVLVRLLKTLFLRLRSRSTELRLAP